MKKIEKNWKKLNAYKFFEIINNDKLFAERTSKLIFVAKYKNQFNITKVMKIKPETKWSNHEQAAFSVTIK